MYPSSQGNVRSCRRHVVPLIPHTGGLGRIMLGTHTASTGGVGRVDDRGDDGHDVGAAAGVGGVGHVARGDDVGRGAKGGVRDVVGWWVTHGRRFVRRCLDAHFVFLTCFFDLVLSEDQLRIVSCRILVN